jgi:hypothetical protein
LGCIACVCGTESLGVHHERGSILLDACLSPDMTSYREML